MAEPTKTELYREAFRELGTDVKFAEFEAYCKKKYGMESVSNSAFYAARQSLQKTEAPPEPRVVASAARVTPPASVPLADLPDLLKEVRSLLGRFGDDKEALVKVIAAI